ncbi:hypothetical protein Bealeia1_00541 [Candidatus Bealeia paramacronuclearis]|uniref:Uncharacterized protein n=2 Tax=Candidatus Bealeia paramacronuclearis TaxID=1921001 RepID=A0ABZ2C3L5_9PROT|nr:hypothetical protein [Candidatus Bealeia paramacronuclearis]
MGPGLADVASALNQPLRTFWIANCKDPIWCVIEDKLGESDSKIEVDFTYGCRSPLNFDFIVSALGQFDTIKSQNGTFHLLTKKDFQAATEKNLKNQNHRNEAIFIHKIKISKVILPWGDVESKNIQKFYGKKEEGKEKFKGIEGDYKCYQNNKIVLEKAVSSISNETLSLGGTVVDLNQITYQDYL